MENWKLIPGFESKYLVSENGEIKSLTRKSRVLKQWKRGEYLVVELLTKVTAVHRLVAVCFIENPENKLFVNHKDGNKLNNHKDNLEWVTRSENAIHMYSKGLRRKFFGEQHPTSKFSNEQIQKVKNLLSTKKFEQREIAKMTGVSQSLISCINRGTLRSCG